MIFLEKNLREGRRLIPPKFCNSPAGKRKYMCFDFRVSAEKSKHIWISMHLLVLSEKSAKGLRGRHVFKALTDDKVSSLAVGVEV